ncbi:MAG: NAD-dependent succinate-semialdehyde dehydrogenase [Thermaerobacter sp.]|nr:NAD-dependent succinate-semialdehyde dehydrogenase [Thermaerobacter sp.]
MSSAFDWKSPTQLLIGGRWVDAEARQTLSVENPATQEEVTRVADGTPADARAALEAAAQAFATWRQTSVYERSRLLRRWYDLVEQDRANLGRLMTIENGKPLSEADAEVTYAASFIEWFSEEAKRAYGRTIPATRAEKRILVLRQPIGIVAAITPWNFPAAMITRKVAPAIAAGCSVVLKPASQTPLTALRLGELLEEAGAPAGLLNIVTSSHAGQIADVWLDDARVRKITFTGSTGVGKHLMRRAAGNMQRLSLELGGQAPFVVFGDADLEVTLDALMVAKFRNGGQSCIAANRVLVEENIVDEFLVRASQRVANLRVGQGLEPGVAVGPMIDAAGREKVMEHIQDALAHGARLGAGGHAIEGAGYFVEPTLLANVGLDMKIMHEETFGPVLAVSSFKTEKEAVETANATEFGLAAYLFTQDAGRAWRVAEALDYGVIGLNDGLPSTSQAPFGGFKESGLGREGAEEGLDAFLETKYVSWGAVGVGPQG